MKACLFLLAFLLLGTWALASDTDDAAAITKLREIPAADPKLADTMNFNDRTVPLLTLSSRGAYVNSSSPVPFDHVLVALAALPASAWGKGRFLIFFSFPPGIHSTEDADPPESAIKQVSAALKSADILINQNEACTKIRRVTASSPG